MMAAPGPIEVITHIVLFKYKPSTLWEAFGEDFEAFKPLPHTCLHPVTQRPYMVVSMRMGKNWGWEPHSKGMTHAFVLEFASQDDLDYYLTRDPVHLEFQPARTSPDRRQPGGRHQGGVLFGPAAMRPPGVTLPGEGGRTWKGACHCGGCEWEVRMDGEDLKHVLCHCDTCKKLEGGPYSCNYIVPREDLKVTKGKSSVYTYKGASGKDVRCLFCPTCTSHIYHHQNAMAGKVIVRTLLLEGRNDFKPGGEIFPEGKLSWVQDLQDSLEPVPTKKALNGVNGTNGV